MQTPNSLSFPIPILSLIYEFSHPLPSFFQIPSQMSSDVTIFGPLPLQPNRRSQQQSDMQEAKKKYAKIISELERCFSQTNSKERMEDVFKDCLARDFKLELVNDSLMEDVLKDYHQKCRENFLGSQTYCTKLDFILQLNNFLYRIAFISRREYLRLNDQVVREKDSPINRWLENLSYLRSSDDIMEFRCEFLTRYCGVDEYVAAEMLEDFSSENLKQLKKYYEDFFRKAIDYTDGMRAVNFIEDNFSRFENKSEMLSPQLIKDLDKKLGTKVGDSNEQMAINDYLFDVAVQNAYGSDPEVQQRLDDQVKAIERTLQKFSGLNIIKTKGYQLRLGKFGSLTSGFAGLDADLDLTVLTNCYVNQIEFLKLLYEFLKKQYKQDEGRNATRRVAVELIINAATPLITVKVGERGRVDLKIDIIVNNLLGVINSKFLNVYSKVRWIKNLGLLVKQWGKARGLINKSMLSSYAMVLMLIHYLIKTRKAKPIIDHRITQDKAFFQFKRLKVNDVERFKVYYEFKEDPKEVSLEERCNYLKQLTGFMKYYAEDFWKEDERYRIITVDQSIDRPVDAERALTIKDPFDEPHNPGRVKSDSREFLVAKFKEAYDLLKSGKKDRIESLFQ